MAQAVIRVAGRDTDVPYLIKGSFVGGDMLLTEGVYAPEVNVIPGLVERSFSGYLVGSCYYGPGE